MESELVLKERSSLSITGVNDVRSFDEERIRLVTTLGNLTVTGSGLHMSRLSVETGEAQIEGKISSLIYSNSINKDSLLKKLFG